MKTNDYYFTVQQYFVTELPDLYEEGFCVGVSGEHWEILCGKFNDPNFLRHAQLFVQHMNSADDPETADFRMQAIKQADENANMMVLMVSKAS